MWELHNTALAAAGAQVGDGPWHEDLHHIREQYLEAGGDFLVGELQGRLVAMGGLMRSDPERAKVRRMRVHPDFWRRGFGQAILERLETRAAELEYRSLWLDTTVGQAPARRLYEMNGYVETHRGRWRGFDLVHYEKAIAPPWVVVRDARPEDAAALGALRPGHTVAQHRDRVAAADGTVVRYLVAERSGEAVGYAFVVLRQPPWDYVVKRLPTLMDLLVREDLRGRGIGTHIIRAVERVVAEAGFRELYLSVDPDSNARALRLYRRLGYERLQETPYRERWEYTDSGGTVHQGDESLIDLRKRL